MDDGTLVMGRFVIMGALVWVATLVIPFVFYVRERRAIRRLFEDSKEPQSASYTRADFLKDIESDVPLEQILEKCKRFGVPRREKLPDLGSPCKVFPSVKLKDTPYLLIDVPKDNTFRWIATPGTTLTYTASQPIVTPKPEPKFKVGQYVRSIPTGDLYEVVGVDGHDTDKIRLTGGCWRYSKYLEPAIPRKGEWWAAKNCAKHLVLTYGELPQQITHNWWDSQHNRELISCCVSPVNFGKGPEAK